jgi:hypothetical protein
LWEAPGWLMSEVAQSRHSDGVLLTSGLPR